MTGVLLFLQVLSAMPDAPHLRARADTAGVPRLAALGAAYMETRNNLRATVRGPGGEWGRYQIKLATARSRCPGRDVTTYDDNLTCFFKMFAEDVRSYGVEPALCVHNTGKPLRRCAYSDQVLTLWKREELWEAAAGAAKDGTSVQTTTAPRSSPSPRRSP